MLSAAALSLFLGLGFSLVTASPISNATALHRGCGFLPSEEFVIQAEAHFAQHKASFKSAAAAATSIPVYCSLHSFSVLFRGTKTNTGLFCRARDLQDRIHF